MLSKITITNKNGFDEVEITEDGKTRSFERSLNGDYAAQRNFAMEKATGDWLLFLDDDEELDLKDFPKDYDAFYLKRLDNFFGKTLRHGETGNIKLIRLGRKTFGSWQGKVHEVWVGSGKVGTLKDPISHTPHPNIKEFIKKINSYTTIRTSELSNFSWFDLLKPPAKFIQNYFLKLGFQDGFPGFVMAYMMSLHSLIVRVKVYEKQNN